MELMGYMVLTINPEKHVFVFTSSSVPLLLEKLQCNNYY